MGLEDHISKSATLLQGGARRYVDLHGDAPARRVRRGLVNKYKP